MLLKFLGVKIDKNKCIAKNIQNLVSITKDHEVTTMSWGDDDEKDVLIGCGSAENRRYIYFCYFYLLIINLKFNILV